MRVRKLIAAKKIQSTDTDWRDDDMQPRFAPLFSRTRPIRAGWQWRSAKAANGAIAEGEEYILIALCNPKRDKWQAILVLNTAAGASAVGRYEYHGDHPGLHIHAHCERGGIETGASSIDNLIRIPDVNSQHRRINAWTLNSFWEAAKNFFRFEEEQGALL